MKVGITGGAGFIGGHVADALAYHGHSPVIFDHRGRTFADFEHMLGDVRDETPVNELAAHCDALIHLAGVLGTQETVRNPRSAVETNMLGMVNVLDACLTWDIPLAAVSVGNFQMLNTYSTTKVAGERLALQFRNELGLRAAVIRPVNAYGPRQSVAPPFGPAKVRKLFPYMACSALSGKPLEVYGDGSQISDMVYVGDVANVFVATITDLARGKVPEHIIEVGPRESQTVVEIAAAAADVAATITGEHVGISHLPMRPGEATGGMLPPIQVDAVHASLVKMGVNTHDARQVVRPLSNRVNADADTMRQVGIDPDGIVPFSLGARQTVKWFAENEGTAWRRPRGGAR